MSYLAFVQVSGKNLYTCNYRDMVWNFPPAAGGEASARKMAEYINTMPQSKDLDTTGLVKKYGDRYAKSLVVEARAKALRLPRPLHKTRLPVGKPGSPPPAIRKRHHPIKKPQHNPPKLRSHHRKDLPNQDEKEVRQHTSPWEVMPYGSGHVVRRQGEGWHAGYHRTEQTARKHAATLNEMHRRLTGLGMHPYGPGGERGVAHDYLIDQGVDEETARHVSGWEGHPAEARPAGALKALREGSRVVVGRPRHVATGLSPETGPARVLNPRLRTGHNRERQISYEIEGEEGLEEGVADPAGLRRQGGKSLGDACCGSCAAGAGACEGPECSAAEREFVRLRRAEDRLWSELLGLREVAAEVRTKALGSPLSIAPLHAVAQRERELQAAIAENVAAQRAIYSWACGPQGACKDSGICKA
jgi:hypothetical protein